MTEQEVRDRKPDGATHYKAGEFSDKIFYYKKIDDKLMRWLDDCHKWVNTRLFNQSNLKPL